MDFWSGKVLEAAKIRKKDTVEEIIKTGFDIKKNAKDLQEFYTSFTTIGG